MLTWTVKRLRESKNGTTEKYYCIGDCLSTDTKPTNGIYNGSLLREMDTGECYKFNGDSGTWLKLPGGSSGSVEFATAEEIEEVLYG